MTALTPARLAETSPQRLARIAGGLYLLNIIGGFFAIGFVSSALVVGGDATATAHNILANALLYRLGLTAHIIILVTNIPLAVIFYDLFKVVNRRFSLMVVFFTLVGDRYRRRQPTQSVRAFDPFGRRALCERFYT